MRLSKRVWCYPELPSLHAFHILPYLRSPLSANCFSCLRAPPPILDTYQKAEGSSASLLPSTKACQGKSIRCEGLNLQCSLCSLRCYDLSPRGISLLRAAKTKFHGLGGLHNPFAHRSGGWQSQVRALAGLVSLADSGSLIPHVAFPL